MVSVPFLIPEAGVSLRGFGTGVWGRVAGAGVNDPTKLAPELFPANGVDWGGVATCEDCKWSEGEGEGEGGEIEGNEVEVGSNEVEGGEVEDKGTLSSGFMVGWGGAVVPVGYGKMIQMHARLHHVVVTCKYCTI